jgi:hypothetical protein
MGHLPRGEKKAGDDPDDEDRLDGRELHFVGGVLHVIARFRLRGV